MIGTSAPSISTRTLSTPRPRNAASRCSAVEHSGPDGIAEHGGEFGGGDGAHVGPDFAFGTIGGRGAQKGDAAVGISGMQREGRGKSGMNADAEHGDVVAQRRLLGALHHPLPHCPRARGPCGPHPRPDLAASRFDQVAGQAAESTP